MIPFVNLHVHTNAGSIGDAIGFPKDIAERLSNEGVNVCAISDHGSMNGVSHAYLHRKALQKQGKDFRFIYGVEVYFVDSLDVWHEKYAEHQMIKEGEKKKRKKADDVIADSDEASVALENEEETKTAYGQANPLNRRYHLVLLAKNEAGYKNLCRLVSRSYERENYYRFPRVDYKMLKEHSEGLVCLSACMGSRLSRAILDGNMEDAKSVVERHLAIFGRDNYFLELQWNALPEQHTINKAVIQLANEYRVKLVSTVDVHYPSPELWQTREIYKRLARMSQGAKEISPLPEKVEELKYTLYPKTGEEMLRDFRAYSKQCDVEYDEQIVLQSFENTATIANQLIEDFEIDTSVHFPSFVIDEGKTAIETLRLRAQEGIDRLFGGKLNAEYQKRFEYELSVIEKRKFAEYFLLMKEVLRENNQNWLVGSARGSAAGCLLSYLLEITQIDPIKYGLLFERFLDPDSDGFPDIDVDVEEPMALKELLTEKWKRLYNVDVVPVSNFTTFQIRNLIKDVSKFYDVPFEEANNVTNVMLNEAIPLIKEKRGIKTGVLIGDDAPTTEEVMEYSKTLQAFLKKYPNVAKQIEFLQGQYKNVSRHASGCILSESVYDRMPVIMSGGVRQTPWTEGIAGRHLEPMGFIKFDILGLATLRTIRETIARVLKKQSPTTEPTFAQIKEFYGKLLHPDALNFDDQAVWNEVFHVGRFLGVFQFANKGAQQFCKGVKPTRIQDLSATTAIFRPGPLAAEFDRQYLHYRDHPEEIEYIHPIVEQNLKSSMGMIVYQEDITKLVCSLGENISFAEGNKLRKVLVKKGIGKNQEFKDDIKTKFTAGCDAKGISTEKSEKLWQVLENTAQYLFNKSHSDSYAVISYTCAYLLHYYPDEWIASFLEKEQDDEEKKAASLALARNDGYSIRDVDINLSGINWTLDSTQAKCLIPPLSSVKGIGDAAIDEIVQFRPFASISELLFHPTMSYRKVNKRALDVLLRGGALSSLMDPRFKNLRHFWSCVVANRPTDEKMLADNIEAFKDEPDFSRDEKLEFKKSLTGLYPIEYVIHPRTIKDLWNVDCWPIGEYEQGVTENCWFIPTSLEIKTSAKGKTFFVIKTIDSSYRSAILRLWGTKPEQAKDILLNRVYIAKPSYDERFGFSLFGAYQMKRLGRD